VSIRTDPLTALPSPLRLCTGCLLTVSLLSGCGGAPQQETVDSATRPSANVAASVEPVPDAMSASPSVFPLPEPASVRANELGDIPVLMIHQVEENARGDYAQTPEQFRQSMEYLATHRYVPVTAAELVTGDLDLPAGTSPVVLTFDDGHPSQFRLLPDGTVDPSCAVGILMSVAEKYPGFRAVGTMYVNERPFGRSDPGPELRWLASHGWEIGNHTAHHANLGALDTAGVQAEIGELHLLLAEELPGYQVRTMSLPFGIMPDDPAAAYRGTWQGVTYSYDGVMLVGAGPAPSPYSKDWNPFAIPRIRSWHGSIDLDEDYWMPRLEHTRYISDGDPHVISYPRTLGVEPAPHVAAQLNPY